MPSPLDDELLGQSQHTPAKRRRRGWKILLALLALLLAGVLVIALVAALYVRSLGSSFDEKVTSVPQASSFPTQRAEDATGKGTTILLLGSDKRPEGGGELGRFGERSDSMMLVNIPEDSDKIYVMSILRDSWVEIPGHGQAKINAAYQYGGMPLTVETVEGLFGTRIDEVMSVDFAGFKGMTDAMGGVTVDVPKSFTTKEGMHFSAGPMHMNGEQALAFVRERYSFQDSDYQRVRDQRAYISAVMDRFLSPQVLGNPQRVQGIVGEISPYLTVSEGLDSRYIMGLVPEVASTRSGDIRMFTVHTNGIGTSADGQSIVHPDYQAMKDVGEAINTGTLDDYYAQHGDDDGSGL